MKPVIALVGAFDRFNFGDLLFPHVVRWGLEQHGIEAEYRCYSLLPADMTDRGGFLTEPLEALRETRLPPHSAVIVAGGELLAARWLDAFSGLSGPRRALAAKIAARLVGTERMDALARRSLGGPRPLPWVVDADDLGCDTPILYNAVGGLGVDRLPARLKDAAARRLARAKHLSVRDAETKQILDTWDLPVRTRLAPDSAALIAELFPKKRLLDGTSERLRNVLAKLVRPYLVFQVGRYPAIGRLPTLAAQLRRIHLQSGLAILLLPLGQAPGHEDIAPLRRITRKLRDLPIQLIHSPDVTEILSAIAGAALFIGSSLHGNLTAMVYGVPHVGFGARVHKLDHFLRQWASPGQRSVNDADLSRAGMAALACGPPGSVDLMAATRAAAHELARVVHQVS